MMTFQTKCVDKKKEIISGLADLVTKSRYGDKNFADELIATVDHNNLNVTTKVSMIAPKSYFLQEKYLKKFIANYW